MKIYLFFSFMSFFYMLARAVGLSESLLGSIPLVLVYGFLLYALHYFLLQKKYVVIVSIVTIVIAYVNPMNEMMLVRDYTSLYSPFSGTDKVVGALVVSGFVFIFIASCIIFDGIFVKRVCMFSFTPVDGIRHDVFIPLMVSLIGTIYFALSVDLSDFTNRVVLLRGSGILSIFGYIGYIAALSSIIYFHYHSVPVVISAVVCMLGGLFFLVMGFRGGAVYPLVMLLFLLISRKIGLPVLVGFILFGAQFFPIVDSITSAIRISFADEVWSFEDVFSLALRLMDFNVVSPSFSHPDLLTSLISLSKDQYALATADISLWNSLLNWIPRALYDEKGLSAGPNLAMYYYPDVLTDLGFHNSSVTTGPIIEGYILFGVFGAFLFAILYSLLLFSVDFFLGKLKLTVLNVCFYWLIIWLFSFSIFVDDFGGVTTKFVLIVFACLILGILRKVSLVLKYK